jgi:4-hydroxythreonine-4-phosphate dehydrogenase
MGDPAGISPDIIAKTLADTPLEFTVLLVGHRPTLEEAFERAGVSVPLTVVKKPADSKAGEISLLCCGPGESPIETPGEASAQAQLQALERAVDAVLEGGFDALATGPVAKNAIATLWPDFTGHTEYLARRSGLERDEVTMVFASKFLFVGLVSTHISMREVPDALTEARLRRTFDHVLTMARLAKPSRRPRIGVAALNPHAGEEGLFGSEEAELLIPFCRRAAEENDAEVKGPLPADSIYREALAGRLDAVVAAYHDQAMIPLKLGGVGQMVNVTMGLPFIRTSPDHGVAYDLARTGRADPSGFRLAFDLAVTLARKNTP